MNFSYANNLQSCVPVGTVHGRFQPLHLGHMEYLLAAKHNCDLLVVGITNPDKRHIKLESTSNHRHLDVSNPLTFIERLTVIRQALIDAGVSSDEFYIVPYPLDQPALIKDYTPTGALHFITIYDDWGLDKKNKIESVGLPVHVLWTRTMRDRLTEGAIVRHRIIANEPWEYLVPPATIRQLKANGCEIISRMKEMSGQIKSSDSIVNRGIA